MEDALIAVFSRINDEYYYSLLFVCKLWKKQTYRTIRFLGLEFNPDDISHIPYTLSFVKELYFEYVCIKLNTKLIKWMEDTCMDIPDIKANCREIYYHYLINSNFQLLSPINKN